MVRITSVIWGSLLGWNLLNVNLCAQPATCTDDTNLRLEITNANNNRVAGLIRNSSPLLPYSIFSKQSLRWPAWTPEVTVYGPNSSTNAPFTVSRLGRNNLFLRAGAQLAPRTISAGSMHFAVLKRDGSVWTWGVNEEGQLGNGTWSGSLIPTQVIGLSNIVAIAAPESSYYNLALDSCGMVWTWGMGWDGELGRADGRYEDENFAKPVPGLSNIVAIAGGWDHSVALKSDGTVWTWGDNWAGQLGDGTTIERDYAAPVPGLTNTIAVTSGGDHNLALCADGTVWAWGYSQQGQLGTGTTDNQLRPVPSIVLTNVISLACGYNHSLALLSDGTVMAWGENNYGQLGNGSHASSSIPVTVPGLSNIVCIAAGDYHSIALDNQGMLFLWGKGFWGQLGNGTQLSIPTPLLLNGISNVVAIAGGQESSIASTIDGKIYIWGLYGCFDESDMRKRVLPMACELENRLDTDDDGLPDWLETGIGADPNNPDSDYDGRTDSQELADGTDPLDPNSVRQVLLGNWRFETKDWKGDEGQLPMICTNIDSIPSWSGYALHIPTKSRAGLSYHETDGTGPNLRFNINLRTGSIVFWYKPDWSSASAGANGPGTDCVLLGSGDLSEDFWGMVIDASGSNLDFRSVKNGQTQTFLTTPVSFTSNQWVQIALTYSTNNSALYVNGQLLQIGDGVSVYPDADFRKTNGFNIGSSRSGENQAYGDFDLLATYNFPLTAEVINANYWRVVSPSDQNVQLPALLINSNQATLTLNGIPSATLAVLVNNTDFSSALWNTYYACSNIAVTFSLPPGDGPYTLAIGFNLDGQTNVITRNITVDTTPPAIRPASQTVTTTSGLLQLSGTGSEPLSNVQFDMVNTCITNLNQRGYLVGAQIDSITARETTNQFQCFDVLLAPGTNRITLRAMDLAGNVTTNVYVYILDISGRTTPPGITLQWPMNNAKISGTNFTVRGYVEDPTTKINLMTIVSSVTNTIAARVGRDGQFLVEQVPLLDGTTQFTLTAKDVAGNTSSITRTVSKSAIALTIDPVNPADLTQPTAIVSGTINAPEYGVLVNGAQAAVSSDGNGSFAWTATVSVPAGGSFPINAAAIPNGGDTPDTETLQTVDKASAVQVLSFYEQINLHSFIQETLQYTALEIKGIRNWTYGSGGSVQAYQAYQTTNAGSPSTGYTAAASVGFNWTASWPPSAIDLTSHGDLDIFDFSYFFTIPFEHYESWNDGLLCPDLPIDGDLRTNACTCGCKKADTRVQLAVGGKGILGQTQLVMLTGSARADDGMGGAIPAENIQINGQKLIPTDNGFGVSFQRFPTGTNLDVTPRIMNYDTHNYTFTLAATNVDFQLAVDNNRDGSITFDSDDQTSSDNPYRFWVNNDFDGYDSSIGDYVDLDPSGGNDANNLTISCTRDLEDYTRLWIDTKGLTLDLVSGKLLLAVEWKDATDDPQIQFFLAAETNGGALYLTDTNVAAQQVSIYGSHIIEWAHRNVLTKYNPFIFSPDFWSTANVSADQPVTHLLFDAISRGSGQLVLSIYKNDGLTKLLESQPIYLKLQDVKEMYERWTVDNQGAVANTATEMNSPYPYDSTIPADNNFILFVHGWNLAPWERNAFAETAFKRLYWQGYKGHFGAFQWPTGYGFKWESIFTDPRNYDNSEFNAWASASGLLNKLTGISAQYPDHVYLFAHSMGNVVAGEALKQAGSNGLVNTYVAMQGAVPTHCYDASTVNRTTYDLPNCYAHYWTTGAPSYFSSSTGARSYINFYNTNDWALSCWSVDQDLKPDTGYGYDDQASLFTRGLLLTALYFPADTYEIFAYADPAPSFALGAQPNVGGVFSAGQLDLDFSYGFGSRHKGHSAEFNSDNMNRWSFWQQFLFSVHLTSPR